MRRRSAPTPEREGSICGEEGEGDTHSSAGVKRNRVRMQRRSVGSWKFSRFCFARFLDATEKVRAMKKKYGTVGVGRVLVGVAILAGTLAPAVIAADPAPMATASSEWSAECTAARAADRIAGENNNYWQTVKDTDKGAWWQLDLGGSGDPLQRPAAAHPCGGDQRERESGGNESVGASGRRPVARSTGEEVKGLGGRT